MGTSAASRKQRLQPGEGQAPASAGRSGRARALICETLQVATMSVLAGMARLVTGVRPIWSGSSPSHTQRIYFANHTSHGDFVLVSSSLPPRVRRRTRAVAAADYWGRNPLRRFIAEDMLSSVLIERSWPLRQADPLEAMKAALAAGCSLIVFPEGTRNLGQEPLLRFRSGLYHLAAARPDVELVPCWIDNMSRVLPKGEFLPVPLLCRTIFGAPIRLGVDEDRHSFLARAHAALITLRPDPNGEDR